ncbi:MAG: hypothetical protein ACOYBJ_01660 [Patescibacteria group bacterium]|jgi:hypothetical protein
MNTSSLSWKQWLTLGLPFVTGGLLLFFLFHRAENVETKNQAPRQQAAAVNSQSAELPTKLAAHIKNAALTKRGVCVFDDTSTIHCFSSEGVRRLELPPTLGSATFAPDGTHVAILYDEGVHVAWRIYNLDTGQQLGTLNPRAREVSFSPDSRRIMYHFENDDVRNLSSAGVDGQDWTAIINLPRGSQEFWWLSEPTLALYINLTATEPVYHLVRLSSKTDVALRRGNGLAKQSLRSNHVLMSDSYESTQPLLILGMGTANDLALESLSVAGTTAFVAWDKDHPIFYGITPPQNPTRLYAYDTQTKQEKTLREGDLSAWLSTGIGASETDPKVITELIGVIDNALYYIINGALYRIILPH